ncbi:RNA polymerase sigma factor [Chitinophaga ginsengisoli]|uniref:RNA polymerase RpoE-like sigma-24 subunit n=1 Tax=Chitinophaga ginsengisoli TaxID=363837 RepID=A0A2P8FUQ0_9BACT|nr:RNA polymerase sigma-70 factor [Chitinophaga ginsengisoli]PSL25449.1 RNA polymerase RpoE-like sigma-24 subunit [Chitinophaga ginsengisoli]
MARHSFDDEKYLQLFISGSEDAFDAIFKRYYEGLLQFTKVLLPYPTDEAEDVVAEMFCTLWHSRRQIAISTTLSAYLYVSVRNRVFDYYRKRKTMFNLTEDVLVETPGEDHQQPDHQLMYKDVTIQIQQLITQLPPQMQLVFKMHRYEGFSYDEIADLLNISLNSVKTHMFRALKILKTAYPILPIC